MTSEQMPGIYFATDEFDDGHACWSGDFLILYILHGSLQVILPEQSWLLQSEEFVVLPQYTFFRVAQEDAHYVVLHLDVSFPAFLQCRELSLACCSVDNGVDPRIYQELRCMLAELLVLTQKGNAAEQGILCGRAMTMLGYLIAHFSVDGHRKVSTLGPRTTGITKALQYLDTHFQTPLTLQEVAGVACMSHNYFSRVFHNLTGQTFSGYLTDLRIQHACTMLRDHEETVTEIALQCGFSNVNSFIRCFREKLGITPGRYRQQMQTSGKALGTEQKNGAAYHHVDCTPLLRHFFAEPMTRKAPAGQTLIRNEVNCEKMQGAYQARWHDLLNIGWARDVLQASVQEQIRLIQREIPHKYLHFHGIFDRDMAVYSETRNGQPRFNFSLVDSLIDFILSVGARPYIEFGFIPPQLATTDRIFLRQCYICMPNNQKHWGMLVKEFLRHCIKTYGEEEVLQWRFMPMEGFYEWIGAFTMEEYLHFYITTWRCVKQIHPALQIAGPAHDLTMINGSRKKQYMEALHTCISEGCAPDFLSLQCYCGKDFNVGENFWVLLEDQDGPLRQDYIESDYMSLQLTALTKNLAQAGLPAFPIVLHAWNSTTWHRDPVNDTCYKAAFLVKNILECQDRVRMMGYWLLTDIISEHIPSTDLFHGGLGLLTRNSLKKAGYHALSLLDSLGGRVVGHGKGWYITRRKDDFTVLLYHYCHFDQVRTGDEQRDREARYKVFTHAGALTLELTLEQFPAGTYEIEFSSISPDHGSVYDEWIRMGSPENLTAWQTEYLQHVSMPLYQVCTETIKDVYLLVMTLKPHEVQRIVFRRIR